MEIFKENDKTIIRKDNKNYVLHTDILNKYGYSIDEKLPFEGETVRLHKHGFEGIVMGGNYLMGFIEGLRRAENSN